jgi:site-specific recombinase XerD
MTNNGVPVKAIADVLGHESVITTMGYLKVNIGSLTQAKSPWPKGGSL